jgi:hypothetical protein
MSVAKEEKLFVSIFDDAVYATKSEGSKQELNSSVTSCDKAR